MKDSMEWMLLEQISDAQIIGSPIVSGTVEFENDF